MDGQAVPRRNVQLTATEQDLFKLALKASQRTLIPRSHDQLADREVAEIATWIKDRSRRIERGERVITWLKFKRLLGQYGVEWEHPKRGNRLNLRRVCVEQRRVGFRVQRQEKYLSTQVFYQSDGSEVARNTIDHVRRELHLDEEHGFDSAAFYDQRDQADNFILQYQQTLKRLGRL